MSANNWTDCPRCSGKDSKKLADAYGKVSLEEYRVLEKEVADVSHPNSLREDWELGIHKGQFWVRYTGTCHYPGDKYPGPYGCGFTFSYEHKQWVLA